MKKNVLKSFFSSGLQAVAVQVLGVLFIGIIAKMLSKDDFGIIQWANATAMFITTILSFGMEQVVVRRIAASTGSDWAAAAFLFHNFIGSVLAFALIVLIATLFPGINGAIEYLPLFFAAQAIIFLVTPLKQFLNAKHMFTPYGVIAVISNTCKVVLALLLIDQQKLTITTAGSVLMLCATIELIAILIYVRTKTSFKLKFRFLAYKKLLKESMPQYMSVIFDSSLSRLDYILIGMISTFTITADYSLAYRAYELARLPIVIIAPVILNIFARMMHTQLNDNQQKLVRDVYRVEVFVAMLIPLTLNLLWSPLLNAFFDDKYGSSNSTEFLLLSICVPIHFFINLMWTLSFSAKKYRKIATVTMLSAALNLILNLVLIPYLGGIGAALAYLATTIFQAVAYYIVVNKHLVKVPLKPLTGFLVIGSTVYLLTVNYLPIHFILQLLVTIAAYIAISFLTGWIKPAHLANVKQYLKK